MAPVRRRLSACLGQGLETNVFPQIAVEKVFCRKVVSVLFYIGDVIYGQVFQVLSFLSALAKLLYPTISFVTSVCPSFCLSVHLERLESCWMDFHQIQYLSHSSRSTAEPNLNASSHGTVIAGEVQMTWRRPLLDCVLRLRSFPSLSNFLT